MGKIILLVLRYMAGLIALVRAIELLTKGDAWLASIACFIFTAALLFPPNIKAFGRVHVLTTHLSFNQVIYLIWPIISFYRWGFGAFAAIMSITELSKHNLYAICNFVMAMILVTPLDRFFFPPLHKFNNPAAEKRRSTIMTLRNTAIFLLVLSLLGGGSIFSTVVIIIALSLLVIAALQTPPYLIISFDAKQQHPLPKNVYADAYVLRWKLTPNFTAAEFYALIKEFQTTLLDSDNYKQQLANHRDPSALKKQALDNLTAYARVILKRREIDYEKKGVYQSYPLTVVQQIEALWKADKKLRSLYNATKKYASQRGARPFWEVAPHVAEYRAVMNVYKRIARAQKKEEAIADLSPDLKDETYFKIIDHLITLGRSMESRPVLYKSYNEELYRDYFLPSLSVFLPKYAAKGEALNHKGKTDILVFDTEGNNIFIAECKIWNGEAYLLQAVDQLLQRYLHWRDERTAIIVFNRDIKNFTQLITVATNALCKHPLCHSAGIKRKDTSWSYWFRHPDDNNRLVRLELILFNFA
jgi:hypothetical protein